MNQLLIDYYRCPPELAGPPVTARDCRVDGAGALDESLSQPGDPARLIDDLRFERYARRNRNSLFSAARKVAKRGYYHVRPLLTSRIRRPIQKAYFADWKDIQFPAWPVDRTVDLLFESLLRDLLRERGGCEIPFIWFWPNGAQSCAIMTHDVETQSGRNFCSSLMDLDDTSEIKSSFQIVPAGRYSVSTDFLESIRSRGFEVNIQDLNHDGCLFDSRSKFMRRVEQINLLGKQYHARGFRAAVLYREPDWYHALDFSYDMSIPTVGHLEVQRGGCCTVMPFFIGKVLELPVSTTQDYSLFHVIGNYSIEVWKKQLSLIREGNGLANFIVHPDYLTDKRARDVYRRLLDYLVELRSNAQMWIPLPGEVDQWWRTRAQMTLTKQRGNWRVDGPGKDRARIAFARLEGDRVVYNVD